MALDPILAAGFKAPDFDDTNRLRDRLALKTAQSDYDQGQAKIARQNKLLDFYRTSDRNSPDFTDNLYKIDPSAAQGEEKSRSEITKARAAALKDQEAVETERFKRTGDQRKGLIQAISSVKDRPDLSKPMVMSVAQGLLRQGLIDQNMFDGIGGELPDDPAQLKAALGSSLQSLLDAEKNLKLRAADPKERKDGQTSVYEDLNPLSPTYMKPQGNAMQLRPSPDAVMTDARVKSEGSLNRDALTARAATKAAQPGKAMSATAQKELFEADDMIEAAQGTITALSEALKINKDTYSGYGAGTRATIVSNLGGSKAADATVAFDNIIQGQALSSMKATFGGNPTEGERKILLDLQAISSKTPEQREEIINRAIRAMERRAKVNADKAASLRGGTYFSEQSPGTQDGDDPVASRNAESAPVSVTSRDEVDRLPSGTQFMGSDGVVRIKP